jgi:uncharacterized OsmC-like protein
MQTTTTQQPGTQSKKQDGSLNGLDTKQLVETVDALKSDATLARFEFRNENQWISGGENRSSIRGFYGAGKEDDSRDAPFVFTNGEPPVLLGDNEGANPVEFLLHALAGCVTTTFVVHATARGIPIKRIETKLVGDIDLQGFLALKDDVPAGYEGIRIDMEVEADAPDEQIDELLAFVREHSPVCNTVCRPVPVELKRTVHGA